MNLRHIAPLFVIALVPFACSKDQPPASPEGENQAPASGETTDPAMPNDMDAGMAPGTGNSPEMDPPMGQPGTDPGTPMQKQGPIGQKNTGGTTGGTSPNGGTSTGGTSGGTRATGGTTGGTRSNGGTSSTGGSRTGGGGSTGM